MAARRRMKELLTLRLFLQRRLTLPRKPRKRAPGGVPIWQGGGAILTPLLIDQFKRPYKQEEEREDPKKIINLSISRKSTPPADPHTAKSELDPVIQDPWQESESELNREMDKGCPQEAEPIPSLSRKDPQSSQEETPVTNAAAPPRKSTKIDPIDTDAWKKVHNDYRPEKWPSVTSMGKVRLDAIRALIGHYKGQEKALEAYKIVLTHIRTKEPWWAERAITFDNLNRKTKNHVIGLYEKAMNSNTRPMPRELSLEQKESIRLEREKQAETQWLETQAKINAERKALLDQLSRNATA